MKCLTMKTLGLKPRRSQMRRWIAPATSSPGRRVLTGTGGRRKRAALPLSQNHSKKRGPVGPGGFLLGQREMIVHTFSYLESLAPGALLYLKSGGKIEAEYLQLSRT